MKPFISKIIFMLSLMLISTLSFADPIWIDVRSIEENTEDSIAGDINIPIDEINPEKLVALYGKDAEINLYCRSGNRAGKVEDTLEAAGFTNVNNLGGIDDVRNIRNIAAQNASQAI